MTDPTPVRRDYSYIQSGDETLFAWTHSSSGKILPVTAVICNPLGVEYMSGHRSIRHLADWLANQGIETLRFDYAFTGDSTGGNFNHASIAGLVANIRDVVAVVTRRNPRQRVVLIGIGLGATFAAIASELAEVDHLIMWNPTIVGRRFVREQKLLSEILQAENAGDASVTDVACIVLTPVLQDEFKTVDLTKVDYSGVRSVLLINRQDRKPNSKLAAAISGSDTIFEQCSMSGYAEMMDQPTETIVPVAVIEHIGHWISSQVSNADVAESSGGTAAVDRNVRVQFPQGDHSSKPLVEIPAKFGPDKQLFGIVSLRQDKVQEDNHKRAYLFLNCGSEHHAGPHRMYTILSRHCASFDGLSFRFDIEGIGDSFSAGNNEDNNSYSPVALQDIDRALDFLSNEYGCSEFILSGLCAGAYHTFKATAELAQYNIVESNLINPLVFEWNYDDPDDHLRLDAHTYRSSVRDPKNWRRLLSGDINYRRLFVSLASFLGELARRLLSRLMNIFSQEPATGLPRDMQSIENLGRTMTLVLSGGDPGLDLMRIQAGKETKRAIARGNLLTHSLTEANHGLSKKYMQDQLIAFFVEKYKPDADMDRGL